MSSARDDLFRRHMIAAATFVSHPLVTHLISDLSGEPAPRVWKVSTEVQRQQPLLYWRTCATDGVRRSLPLAIGLFRATGAEEAKSVMDMEEDDTFMTVSLRCSQAHWPAPLVVSALLVQPGFPSRCMRLATLMRLHGAYAATVVTALPETGWRDALPRTTTGHLSPHGA